MLESAGSGPSRGPAAQRSRPPVEERRTFGGLGPEIPGCEGGRYVGAREEVFCVMVVS